jgi:hypothetical protein
MPEPDLDALMDANAAVLGLTIDPAWRASIRANLLVSFRMGTMILDAAIDDETDPAPVFRA